MRFIFLPFLTTSGVMPCPQTDTAQPDTSTFILTTDDQAAKMMKQDVDTVEETYSTLVEKVFERRKTFYRLLPTIPA